MKRSKGSREAHRSNEYRKDVQRKLRFSVNRWDIEKEELYYHTAKAMKKLENSSNMPVPEDNSVDYRILNFTTVFGEISQFVKCKKCDSDVQFYTEDIQGLSFKIMISCKQCEPTLIPSCAKIGLAYEINRRFAFAMRCLGQGANAEKKFCGLMDLPPPVTQKAHDKIRNNIYEASKTVARLLMKQAVKEEQQRTSLEEEVDGEITDLGVPGDGTWQKRGYTSAFGVCSLIGVHSNKVLDVNIKSAYCKTCEVWSKHDGTEEYNEWKNEHEKVCPVNHEGSSGKMKVDAITEMFHRSEKRYGVRYVNYIGDGDSKTFKGVIESKPYSEKVTINKKECIGHIQKRMGARLRKCKKDNKGIGGRNKLSAKMIDKLTVYYGLAIRRNFDSVKKMREAIWATFYHYSSTTGNPHHLCPEGSESWCEWHQAKAKDRWTDTSKVFTPYLQKYWMRFVLFMLTFLMKRCCNVVSAGIPKTATKVLIIYYGE